MKKLKKLNEIQEAVKSSGKKVTLVTHDGVCHSDDAMTTALLEEFFQKVNLEFQVLRTRNYKEVESLEETSTIIYDVFGGSLDHHGLEEVVEGGRPLSSIGKTWRWGKEEFKKAFNLSEEEWNSIDAGLFFYIDKTDNTGVMNPFNAMINRLKKAHRDSTMDEQFNYAVNRAKRILHWVLKNPNVGHEADVMDYCFTSIPREEREALQAEFKKEEVECERIDRIEKEEFAALPVRTLYGRTWKMSLDKFRSSCGVNHPGIDGYIWWDDSATQYGVRLFNGATLRPGIQSGQIPGVVFTHKSGFVGAVKTLEDIPKVL